MQNSGHLRLCQQPRAAHELRSSQISKIVATFVYASSQGQHTHFAQTNFLHISSSWVKIRLHTENQLPRLPGSALKVYSGWVGGVVPS